MDIPYKFNEKIIIRGPSSELPFDKEVSKENLMTFFSQKKNAEALYLASPGLYASFKAWAEGEKVSAKEELKLRISLVKYFYRMHSRSTPFGLFSGCSVGKWSDRTNIERKQGEHSRFTSMDMKATCSLIHTINQSKLMRQYLRYYPNSSIYEVRSNTIRYVEYKIQNGKRKYQIAEVKDAQIVKEILEVASGGKTLTKLSDVFKQYGYEKEEVLEFINDLIDSQLLVSELEPILIGPDSLEHVYNIIKRISSNSKIEEIKLLEKRINNLLDLLKEFDSCKEVNIDKYKEFAEQVKKLDIPFEVNHLLQVDMNIGVGKVEVSGKHQKSLLNTITVLNKLSHYNRYTELDSFKEQFVNRYGEREVNLGLALDSELGIGFGNNKSGNGVLNPLLNSFPSTQRNSGISKINWSKIDSYLLNLYEKSRKNLFEPININSREFENYPIEWDSIPNTVSFMFKLLKKNEKEQLLIKSVGNSSAANMLSRFSGANSEIKNLVNEIGQKESELSKEVVHAEIAHLPQSRTGNVLQRPELREHELVYLSNSLKPGSKKIFISDLFVSVKQNRIILRSKKLNKEVIPHLSNAHNFTNDSLPVYHFLCELQYQNKRKGIAFNWGSFSKNLTFLPRVMVDEVIVYEATWQLSRKHFGPLLKKDVDLKKEIRNLQNKFNIPNKVRLCNSDNELYINLKHDLDRHTFQHEIKKQQNIVLKEYLYDHFDSLVSNGSDKKYASEFLGILERNNISVKVNGVSDLPIMEENIQQYFYPGSEWCYVKIYCGVKTADSILLVQFKQLFTHLKNENIIDEFFFIRYSDPEFHLRLRFKLVHKSLYGELMRHLNQFISELSASGLIWKSEIATYERELNRYGRKTMALSEEYFMMDSQFVLQMLDLESTIKSEKIRWMGGITAVDRILGDFGFNDLDEKMTVINSLCEGYNKEFDYQKAHKVFIDKTFRKYSADLWNLFYEQNNLDSDLMKIVQTNKKASEENESLVLKILEKFDNQLLEIKLTSYVKSQIHMTLNRLFHSKGRMNEFVIYNLLQKLYQSRKARLKHSKRNKTLIETEN